MLNHRVLKVSPHGSFPVTQLCESVAIGEAVNGERDSWGNATDTESALLVDLGCSEEEVSEYLKNLKSSSSSV